MLTNPNCRGSRARALLFGSIVLASACSSASDGDGGLSSSQQRAADRLIELNEREGTPTDRDCIEVAISRLTDREAIEVAERGWDYALNTLDLDGLDSCF